MVIHMKFPLYRYNLIIFFNEKYYLIIFLFKGIIVHYYRWTFAILLDGIEVHWCLCYRNARPEILEFFVIYFEKNPLLKLLDFRNKRKSMKKYCGRWGLYCRKYSSPVMSFYYNT